MSGEGLKMIVCVKQTPASQRAKLDPETSNLSREGQAGQVNPYDLYALELALCLRDDMGGEVICVSMGPPQAREALEEATARGVDRGVLISDATLAGSDTLATSRALAAAVRRLQGGVVFCGKQSIDGDTAQVGPGVAERLGWPVVSRIVSVDRPGSRLRIVQEGDDERVTYEVRPPVVLTVEKTPTLLPRLAVAGNGGEIETWNGKALGLSPSDTGLAGSPTRVVEITRGQGGPSGQAAYPVGAPVMERLRFVLSGGVRPREGREMFEGDDPEALGRLVDLVGKALER